MKSKHLKAVSLLLVGLAMVSFTAKDSVMLRLKPQQGKAYSITAKTNMMMMMEVQGQSMNMSQNMEIRQSFSAKEITDAQNVIETQIEAIKMSMSQMGMKLEYDSEHPEKTSPMLAGQTKEMEKELKKPATVTYDALGKAIDSLVLNTSRLDGVIVELPEKEVSVGSSWTFNKSQEVSGTEINAQYTYTITAISKKSVDVSFNGIVEGNKEISGTYEGSASINPQTGLVMNSSTKSNLSLTINEQGLSIPMTMVGNSTIEVK